MRASGNCTLAIPRYGSSCSSAPSSNLFALPLGPPILVAIALAFAGGSAGSRASARNRGRRAGCALRVPGCVLRRARRARRACESCVSSRGLRGRRETPVGRAHRRHAGRRQFPPVLGQHRRPQCPCLRWERSAPAGLSQMPELAVTRVERLVELVAQVGGRCDAERPDDGEIARFGSCTA